MGFPCHNYSKRPRPIPGPQILVFDLIGIDDNIGCIKDEIKAMKFEKEKTKSCVATESEWKITQRTENSRRT